MSELEQVLEGMDELVLLLEKIAASEELVRNAEQYFDENHQQWSPGVAAYFQDLLERKKDQIDYEWYRVRQMGLAIASGRDHRRIDI